jgi:hypothetical protein
MTTIWKVRVGEATSWQPTIKAAKRWSSDRLPILGSVDLEFEEYDKPGTAAEFCRFLEAPEDFRVLHDGGPPA